LVLAVDGVAKAVDLFADGGRGTENSITIDEGADGRILIGDNDDSSEIERTATDIESAAVQEITGPMAINPYLFGDLGLGKPQPS